MLFVRVRVVRADQLCIINHFASIRVPFFHHDPFATSVHGAWLPVHRPNGVIYSGSLGLNESDRRRLRLHVVLLPLAGDMALVHKTASLDTTIIVSYASVGCSST